MAEMTENTEELEKDEALAPEDQEQSNKKIIYNALVNEEDEEDESGEKKEMEHLKDGRTLSYLFLKYRH